MITFESPVLLMLIAVVPSLIYLAHLWKGRGGHISFSFTIWQKEILSRPSWLLRFLMHFSSLMYWLGLISLIVALAGPSISERKKIYLNRGLDILFILDQSPSMAAQDFSPVNRFETAKGVIRDFVQRRSNDSIGLVSFGSEAALRVPPTRDYRTLVDRVEGLRIMELGDGTAIGMGIAVACVHLNYSTADNKIAVLITDGKNNAGEISPLSAAKIAFEMGIKLYTIGVGTRGEVPIEFLDPETGNTIRGKINSEYDEELLQTVAELTGGRYFSAASPGSLQSVFSDIDSIETVKQRVRMDIKTEPIHRQFIIAGFVMMIISFFLRKMVFREVL